MAEISKVRFNGTDYDIKSITDTSLSEAGTPADAAETGEQISGLKKDILPLNLVGMNVDELYEFDPPIKIGESFTISVADGSQIGRFVDYKYYDAEKTQLGNERFYATSTRKTIKASAADIHYFSWSDKPAKIMKVERGETVTNYTPFYRKYRDYAPGFAFGDDYYKNRIGYPFSFTTYGEINKTTGAIGKSLNYETTEPIPVKMGDVLHYNLGGAGDSEAIIALYDLNGAFVSTIVAGQGQSKLVTGEYTLLQDGYVIASHRKFNITNNDKSFFYINDSVFRKAQISITDDQAKEDTFVSGYGDLSGWEPHAIAFSKLMADVEETEGFLYFTDSHFMSKTNGTWKSYIYDIIAYIEKLYYATPCSFVLHGGDWLGSGEDRLDYLYKLSVINGTFRRNFDKYALLVGNHECGNQSAEHTMFTHDTLAATLLANVGKTYYMFDANTFRMYCFDTWQSGALDTFGVQQLVWFAEALRNDNSKHIVIAMHILYDSGNLREMGNQISLCAKAYNSRGTYTYNDISYDYSASTGKVGFIIAGHEHGDRIGTVNDIPFILTTNLTGYGNEANFDLLPLPIDLMKVDWQNGKLTAYRATRGTDGTTRELNILK